MRGLAALTVAVATFAGLSSASAQFRIAEDRGGQIGPYLQQFAMIRASGERVVIDGNCFSACTLILGSIPPDRICVTARAKLGFHAAWNLGPGGNPVHSPEGTRLLWDFYPAPVREWIARKGGLTPKMIYLRGRELRSLYANCDKPDGFASTVGPGKSKNIRGRTSFAAKP
ncbi:MAG: hypothetical protein WD073_01555 [Xanthobacteraceae bacterium]